ncbi:GNAT family N-acetyltransferase [Armatimonas sp.]|uniref:GNAT family N-acetyltransferase n=1 Tax=Armatimonas sp. TaxID=1872638 RepID=UPI00286BB238|nr:GNAT family N-acetyltransferase [Armatimonas sp.]
MFSSLNDLLIRPLTRADKGLLPEALYQALYVSPQEIPLSRDLLSLPEFARYIERWGERRGDLGSVAILKNRHVIGVVWLRLFPRDTPGYGFVDEHTPELLISVHPEWRGCGIGTKLLEVTLQQARGHFPAVSLSVTPGNPAQHLYERLGFTVVRTCINDITMRSML